DAITLSKISTSLLIKQLIFDFAVQYRASNEVISDAKDFDLGEKGWNAFLEFIVNKDYAYQTDTEKELEQLAEKAKKEGYFDAIKSNYENLQEQLNHDKKADVIKNRKEIERLI